MSANLEVEHHIETAGGRVVSFTRDVSFNIENVRRALVDGPPVIFGHSSQMIAAVMAAASPKGREETANLKPTITQRALAGVRRMIRKERACFGVMASARKGGAQRVHIRIDGCIGRATASRVIRQLRAAPHARQIDVEINSEGGLVHEAVRIYAALRAHGGRVVTSAGHDVASAATIVFVAGDVRKALASSAFLIHPSESARNVSNVRWTAERCLKQVEALLLADATMAALIRARTGRAFQDFAVHYTREREFSGREAKRLNLATELTVHA